MKKRLCLLPLIIGLLFNIFLWETAEVRAANDAGDKAAGSKLISAVENNKFEAVKELIRAGADINERDSSGMTALLVAARRNRAEIAKYLLEQGADLSIMNKDGLHPLLLACSYGQDGVVNVIAERADVNIISDAGTFPLLLSSNYDYDTTTAALIEKGANVNLRNNQGVSPLLIASQMNSLSAAAVLLKHGADPNLENKEGWTPLMLASRHGHIDMARILIDHNANMEKKNSNDMTALLLAIETDHLNVAKLLAEKGANPAVKEDFPYATAMSYYLAAESGKADNRPENYASASQYFDRASEKLETILAEYRNKEKEKHALTIAKILTEVVLLSTVGITPLMSAETTVSIQDAIKKNEERLNRCRQLKQRSVTVLSCLNSTQEKELSLNCAKEVALY